METHANENRQENEAEKEIPPTEDLMREHGVLKRILLIYEDVEKRLKGEKWYDPYLINPVILHTASITRNFIENIINNLRRTMCSQSLYRNGNTSIWFVYFRNSMTQRGV